LDKGPDRALGFAPARGKVPVVPEEADKGVADLASEKISRAAARLSRKVVLI
jgi:hypothetical protein